MYCVQKEALSDNDTGTLIFFDIRMTTSISETPNKICGTVSLQDEENPNIENDYHYKNLSIALHISFYYICTFYL